MAAGIKEATDFAFPVAAENDRSSSDVPGLEVSRVFQFRRMTDIDPATGKDATDLLRMDLFRYLGNTIEQEDLSILIVDNIGCSVHLYPL